MGFQLTVTFSGIIAFARHPVGAGLRMLIPDTSLGGGSSNPSAPDAERHALDGWKLERHYPRVHESDISGAVLHEVTRGELSINASFKGPNPGLTGSLANVVSMEDVWGGGSLDPMALQDPGACSLVWAHLDVFSGKLTASKVYGWSLNGYLRNRGNGGSDLHGCYAAEIQWTLTDLTSATIRSSPYSGGGPEWEMQFDADAQIAVVNHCFKPGDPLPSPEPNRRQDDDFRWHYVLLGATEKAHLRSALSSDGLPIPRPENNTECPDPVEPLASTAVNASLGRGRSLNPPFGNCIVARWF